MASNFRLPEKIYEEIEKKEQLDISRENADISSKLSGFATAFSDNNYIAKIHSLSKEYGFESNTPIDKEFMDSNNDDRLYELVKQHNISREIIPKLREAKNQQHENWLISEQLKKDYDKKLMNENLSPAYIAAGSITGMLLDIDTLGVGPVSALLTKGLKTNKVFQTTLAVETGGALVKSYVDDNYEMSDALIDMTLGTTIGTVAAKYFRGDMQYNNSKIAEDLPSNEADIPLIEWKPVAKGEFDDITDDVVKYDLESMRKNIVILEDKLVELEKNNNIDEAAKIRYEIQSKQQYISDKVDEFNNKAIDDIVKNDKPFMDWMKDIQRKELEATKEADAIKATTREEADRIAELRVNAAKYREELRLKTEQKQLEAKKKIEDDLIESRRKQEIINRNKEKREYFETIFKSDKYSDARISKRTFFEKQNRIIKEAETKSFEIDKTISKIKSNIETLKQGIKSIETRLSNNTYSKGHERRLRKELQQKKDLLKGEKDKLSSDVNLKRIEAKKQELKELEDIVNNISDNLEEFTISFKSELDEVKKLSPSERDEFVKGMEDIVNELTKKHPNQMNAIKSAFENLRSKNHKGINLGNMSKKKKAMVLGAMFAGTAAMADDGSESDIGLSTIIMATVASLVIGKKVLSIIQSNNGVFNAASMLADKTKGLFKAKEFRNSPDGKHMMDYMERGYNRVSSAINSTLKEIDNMGSKELSDFARKLMIDPIDGSVRPLEIEKNGMLRSKLFQFNTIMDVAFKSYIKEAGIGVLDIAKNMELRTSFNKAIADALDFGTTTGNKHIDDAVKGIRSIFDEVLDDAKNVGVKGADEVKKTGKYLPRLWRFSDITRLLHNTDKKGIETFTKALSKVITNAKDSDETAKQLVRWFMNDNQFVGKSPDDIARMLDEFLIEGVSKEQIEDALTTTADKAGRLKNRIEIDFSKWDDNISINVSGKDVNVELDKIVERDIYNVMNSYLNQMYGSIALANKGWKTISQFDKELKVLTEGNHEAREALEAVKRLLLGQPIDVANTKTRDLVSALKGITFFNTLGLVAFSMLAEGFKVVQYAGIPRVMKNLTSAFAKANKETEAFRSIQELTGLGTHSARDRLDLKGLDNSEYGEVAANSFITRTSVKLQEATARVSGLVKFSDVFQKYAGLTSATNFAKLVNNMKHNIPEGRFSTYGINDDAIKMFKDDFGFDSNGDLLAIDYSKWSYKKKTVFNDIIWKINQDYTPEVLLGTTGRWMKDSEIGKVFSFLLTYPINLFSTQAARDLHHRDMRAVYNNFLTFAGSYAGLVARYEAEQKEYTHEQIFKYSLMNLPAFGLISSIRSISDPAMVSVMNDIKMSMDTIGGQAYDELIGE